MLSTFSRNSIEEVQRKTKGNVTQIVVKHTILSVSITSMEGVDLEDYDISSYNLWAEIQLQYIQNLLIYN